MKKWVFIGVGFISVVIGLCVIGYAIYPYTLQPFVERTRGNERIDYYGQIVDENGVGVGGVAIAFQIVFSDGAVKPGMFGRSENLKYIKVFSDQNGDFAVKGEYGYAVRIEEVWQSGERVGLRGVNLDPSEDPGYGIRMDDRSSRRKLPDNPSKRVICKVVPL
jgi:hypothetical protein